MAALAELMERYPDARTFRFGDTAEICAHLTGLVRSGAKTATVTALRDVASGAEAMPAIGRRDIALDWEGRPALVIETTAIAMRRFDEVDEDFALAEGEGASLETWREDHRAWLERTGGFARDMMLICERFRVVEICDAGDGGETR